MKLTILLVIIFSGALFAQPDWERWEAREISYEVDQIPDKTYEFDHSGFTMFMISGLKNAYYFFISDLDGDNCPFTPSCSAFFVEAVRETNPFKGALMFADRFTRDLNLFKSTSHYHIHPSGRFYDPVSNYTLIESNIINVHGER